MPEARARTVSARRALSTTRNRRAERDEGKEDALMVYRETYLPEEFMLPLWPAKAAFNSNPTVAMVAAGTVIVAANSAVLLVSKVSVVCSSCILGGLQSVK